MNTPSASLFPTSGTWLSRWYHLYTEVPAVLDVEDAPSVTALPRAAGWTTAA